MDNYGMLNLNVAREFNTNSSGLNGIIAKLAGYDVKYNFKKIIKIKNLIKIKNIQELLNALRGSLTEQVKTLNDTKLKKDELDTFIHRELEKIKHELFEKLQRMFEDLRNHQMTQKANGLKFQQEISILKKEKLDLYQKTTDLQKRIGDMEDTIGQDVKN